MTKFNISNIITLALIISLSVLKSHYQFSWLTFILLLLLILVHYTSYLFIGSYFVCSNIYMKAICKGKENIKSIALSFDDGPDEKVTPEILRVLKEHNAKAVFFVKGENAEKYPEIIQKIVEDGHIIGNHTFSHSSNIAFLNRKKIRNEIEKTNNLISCFTGKPPRFFRPPFGVLNPIIASVAEKFDMITIGWSIRSFDGGDRSCDMILNSLKAKINAGAIILFHDTNPGTINVIKEFLDYLAQTDYTVERLDKLINIEPYV